MIGGKVIFDALLWFAAKRLERPPIINDDWRTSQENWRAMQLLGRLIECKKAVSIKKKGYP